MDAAAINKPHDPLQNHLVTGPHHQQEALDIVDDLRRQGGHAAETSVAEEAIAGGSSLQSFISSKRSRSREGLKSSTDAAAAGSVNQLHDFSALAHGMKVKVSQVFSNGEEKEVMTDIARFNFLESISEGLNSEDIVHEGSSSAGGWWSNIISSNGTFLDPVLRPPINNSASFEAMQGLGSVATRNWEWNREEEEENCKIYVMDVNSDIGPKVGSKYYDLSYKRIWPFGKQGQGIDGSRTLPAKYHQSALEYWIVKSIRSSNLSVDTLEDADIVFVDMWAYHMAWIAYMHPLGSRNMSNPEAAIRRAVKGIVQMDRYVCVRIYVCSLSLIVSKIDVTLPGTNERSTP